MKILRIAASAAIAALMLPALASQADEQTPPPQGEPPHMRPGFGGPKGEFMSPELKKLLEQYKTSPSDDLKAQIKAKLGEAFDKHLKDREEFLKKEQDRIAEMKANRDKEIDARLEKALSGKQDEPRKPRHNKEKEQD